MGDGSTTLAVAQVTVSAEVPDAAVVQIAGKRIREAIAEAAIAGAHVVQFPEGALTYPGKRAMSATSPERGPADWSRADWPAIRHELESIAAAARDHRIWAVVGAPHRLTGDRWPHNSLYVFSDAGALVTRYDKRRLSTNEVAMLYTPGTEPVTFVVDGVRFGMAICLEALFPELFVEYAALDVDVVLLSSAPDANFAALAHAHAVMNALVVSVAFAASDDVAARSGVCTPFAWLARGDDGLPAVVTAEVPGPRLDRTFHRRARTDLYIGRQGADDPRSADRRAF